MPKKSACAARVAAMADDEFTELAAAVGERRRRDECGSGACAGAAAPYRPDPARPSCGAAEPSRDGRSESGLRRHRCGSCGTRFDSLTGTVLERCGKELAAWVGFVNPMGFNVPPGAAAETCRATRQTAWEWRHRIFAAVDGHQGRIAPRDGVWIDEAYVSDTGLCFVKLN